MHSALSTPLVWQCDDDWCVGQLHLAGAPGAVQTGILIVAGGTQTRVGAHRGLWALARDLTQADRAILRFDSRGTGDSTGEPTAFEARDRDIACAITELRRCCPAISQLVLIGHCDGASAALIAAGNGLEVDHLILINPWARTAETAAASALEHNYGVKLFQRATWRRVMTGQVNLWKASISIFNGLKSRLKPRTETSANFVTRMEQAWRKTRCPISVVLGTADATAQEFALVSKSWRRSAPGSFHPIENGDHSFSSQDQHAAVLAQIELALVLSEG